MVQAEQRAEGRGQVSSFPKGARALSSMLLLLLLLLLQLQL